MRTLRILLTILCAVSTAGLVITRLLPQGGPGMPWVVVASTAFILVAVPWGRPAAGGIAVLIGLVCCWVGDVTGLEGYFLTSVASFWLGHACFIVAFARRGLRGKASAMAAPVVAIAAVALGFWFIPHVAPALRLPVLAYIGVISLMVVCAAGAAHDTAGRVALVGAVVFFISDIFVARGKFITHDTISLMGTYPLYYTACLCLAWSVSVPRVAVAPTS